MKNPILLFCISILFHQCSLDTKIIRAAKEKDLDKVRSLISQGEDVNAVGECYNALSIAVNDKNMELIELLLSKGSNPNVRNYECFRSIPYVGRFPIGRDTALIYSGNLEITKALIGAGADPNILDINGYSPLQRAVINGYTDIAEYLISKGANVNLFDKDGKNIHLKAANSIQKSKPNESEKLLKILTAANAKDFDFESAKTDTTVHESYFHSVCRSSTKMGKEIATAVTNRPIQFSPQTYCASEKAFSHYSEFNWEDNQQNMMQWYIKRLKDTKKPTPTAPSPAPAPAVQ
ncbi:ankyrin repeat domain-containing protein [Leptospira barantonii]|uniref:Ankyrin repeat domain-containing protein n=1 Tax=Leptospira barantonii TaxID=2023184 RepID=A0A5F2BBW2_9LEPT|nr:ankyrin repeat domain-containing protein [Leptospira barantonii]TGM03078.1 ankyrin repeat domain-containing protein [Leptospira barantonii]